ncbi:hypothetical protein E4T39_04563 [Aureobasidium subglaciale]|nr:hypothetical protein E4T39_04563 [Aureobasidium subglaciale]
MSKRSWSVANAAQGLLDMNSGSRSATNATSMSPPQVPLQQDSPNGPQISRKVKACAACRKQKVMLIVMLLLC